MTRTAAALEANGISVLRAADAAEAKRIVLGLIPDGSQVHHGASESLEASGIIDEIEKGMEGVRRDRPGGPNQKARPQPAPRR